MTSQSYTLFGLTVASAVPIPWAPTAAQGRSADVVIRHGHLAETAPGAEGGLQFTAPEVARYRISGGAEIVVDSEPGADEEDIRLYLLGSALGVLLHQRGLLVLHANAIVIEGEAALFMGPSGAGKSTLAGWFAAQGHEVLTDDVCAVEIGGDGAVRVLPGLTRLRLAEDAAENLSFDTKTASKCPTSDKYEIGLPAIDARSAVPLRACYVLSEQADAQLRIRPLRTVDAVEMLMANTYRGHALKELGGNAGHVEACVRIAGTVPCFRVERAKDWARFDAVAEALAAHAGDQRSAD